MAIGSWGTPEWGVTEWLAGKISGNKTTDLSNAISGNYSTPPQTPPPTYTPPTTSTSSARVYNTPNTAIPTAPSPQSSIPNPQSNNNYDLQGAINSIYNPQYDSLNAKQALLPGQQKLEEDQLANQYNDLNQMVTNQVNQTKTEVGNQTTALDEGKRNAYGESLRQFNLLQQQNQSRFGGGTGAGAFISDLLNQEFMRANGNREVAYTGSIKALRDYSNKVMESANQEYLRLEKEKNLMSRSIVEEFKSRTEAIEADKRMLDSAKAEMKEQAIRDAMNNQQTLQNAYLEHQYNLEMWQQEQKGYINQGISEAQRYYSDMNEANQGNYKGATTSASYSQYGGDTSEGTTYQNPFLPQKKNIVDDVTNDEFDITKYFA